MRYLAAALAFAAGAGAAIFVMVNSPSNDAGFIAFVLAFAGAVVAGRIVDSPWERR